jgi:hypothetical protein
MDINGKSPGGVSAAEALVDCSSDKIEHPENSRTAGQKQASATFNCLADLADIPIWVAWREEKKDGKPTKVPKNPRTGGNALVPTDPRTYGARAVAERRAQQIQKTAKGGIGVVLSPLPNGQHLTAIDLDSCRDIGSGAITDRAREVLDRFRTYSEVSPSLTGVKFFFRMTAADMGALYKQLGCNHAGKQITRKSFEPGDHREMAIDTARFCAVTEQRLEDYPEGLRLVPFVDVEWFLKTAGPDYLAAAQQSAFANNQQHVDRDNSGSGHGFRFMQECHAAGMDYEQACEAILADESEAGEWANRVDERQIERAWERSKKTYVDRLNERHAVVRMGSKTAILDEQPGQPPQFMTTEDFHLWYANDQIQVAPNKSVAVSRVWIEHPRRRQYTRVVFDPTDHDPDHFNLWRGFAVKPDASKTCKLLLAHLRDNICGEDEDLYRWVLGVFAHMVQKPEEKAGVALVLRGKEGTGKGFLARWLSQLCPQHYVAVSQATHITGRFNAHLQQALLVFVDEAFWAGDKAGEGALKHLVTDKDQLIEAKHITAYMVQNLSRLIIASNEYWVVPAGLDARRWAVLDVSDLHMNDRKYFGEIEAEMKNGGLEALMHTLVTFDLSTVDIFTVPKTAALLDQKTESLPVHERWWLECLQQGWLDNSDIYASKDWPEEIEKTKIWASYGWWADKHNVRNRLWPSAQLHKWFSQAKLLPGSEPVRPRDGTTCRPRKITLPGLAACREAYAAHIGQTPDWNADEDHVQGLLDLGPR